MKKQNVVNLSDGAYENAMTGLGIPGIDKNEDTRVSLSVNEPNYISLASQYAKDGIVGRLVDIPPVKALKSPITIIGDDDGTSYKALSAIGGGPEAMAQVNLADLSKKWEQVVGPVLAKSSRPVSLEDRVLVHGNKTIVFR